MSDQHGETSSLYFGLDIFCLFEAWVLKLDTQKLPFKYWEALEHVKFWGSSLHNVDRIHQAQNKMTTSLATVIPQFLP
jgi:hypothetical protein